MQKIKIHLLERFKDKDIIAIDLDPNMTLSFETEDTLRMSKNKLEHFFQLLSVMINENKTNVSCHGSRPPISALPEEERSPL